MDPIDTLNSSSCPSPPVLVNQSSPIGTSARAIQHHYDIGNDFYRLWLDNLTTSYSAALWQDNDTLESAQLRKINFHIDQAHANNTQRVLDIGCGWGGTLKQLIEHHNVQQAVGLTLSQKQAEWIQQFNHPQIHVHLSSWVDYVPDALFDAIISIGAFEHFATLDLSSTQKIECYRAFFQRCHEWLKPGCWLSLQTIVYDNYSNRNFSQFFSEEIFPESNLPYLAEIVKATERLFEVISIQNNREHYVRTLKSWRRRLKGNRQEATNLVGEDMVRKYEKYLGICMIGFHTGRMNLSRLSLRRIDSSNIDSPPTHLPH